MKQDSLPKNSFVLSPWIVNTLDDYFDYLIGDGMLRRYHAEQILFHEGEDLEVLFYLISGRVRLTMAYPHGSDLLLAIYEGRNFIGASAIDGLPFFATVRTHSDATVVTIPLQKIKKLMKKDELLVTALTKSLCQVNRQLAGQVYCVAMTDASARVIRLLYSYALTNDILICTHNDIATTLGLSRTTVTIILNSLESANIIKKARSKIVIKNRERLKILLEEKSCIRDRVIDSIVEH